MVAPQPDGVPFAHIGIVGLGLIGGSVALAAKSVWPGVRISGIDTESICESALARGVIDDTGKGLGALAGADLIVLAAPVGQTVAMLPVLAEHVAGSSIVTDVGSTKRQVLAAAAGLPARLPFVAGHPLAGSEHSGFVNARGELFHDRPWVLTPEHDTPAEAVARVTRFITDLGARPTVMDAAEHDRLMAFVSHLPQLAASALMGVVGAAVDGPGLDMAGPGLRDTTRLASSSPSVWQDVCLSNADDISEALEALISGLQHVRDRLDRGETVTDLFDEASRYRRLLTRERR